MITPKKVLEQYLQGIIEIKSSIGNEDEDAKEIERQRQIFLSAIKWLGNLTYLQRDNPIVYVDDLDKLKKKLKYARERNKILEKRIHKLNYPGQKNVRK